MIDNSNAERDCLIQIQAGPTQLRWPLKFVERAPEAAPTVSVGATLVDARPLSQAMTLVSHVLAANEPEGSPRSVATFGTGRGVAVGRAARIVRHESLSFEPINVKAGQLKDLAHVLDRMGGTVQLARHESQISFATERAYCTFVASAATPMDLSQAETLLPLYVTNLPTSDLSGNLAKIVSQSSAKDDLVWWRLDGPLRAVRLTMPVNGGEAMVTFDLPETDHHAAPVLDARFERRTLSMLTPLGRVRETALHFYPELIMSRQVQDETTVDTFLSSIRANA